MEKLSVFGGTGFVGSEVCRITKRDIEVIERESREPVSKDVLYLISTTHNYHVFDDVHKDVDTNLTILLDVLKNLKPDSTFNFISSWFVYGDADLPATEESPCGPKGFYSITKKCAEELVVSYCQTFGHDYRILRLCNVYGKNDPGSSKKKNALQFLIERLKNDEPIDLYHAGQFYRDYMHVTDVARAIELCLKSAPLNSIINIGSGEKVLFKDIIDLAILKTNSKSIMKDVDPPDFHKVVQVKDFYMSTDRLKRIGFKPQISLEQGISELCQ